MNKILKLILTLSVIKAHSLQYPTISTFRLTPEEVSKVNKNQEKICVNNICQNNNIFSIIRIETVFDLEMIYKYCPDSNLSVAIQRYINYIKNKNPTITNTCFLSLQVGSFQYFDKSDILIFTTNVTEYPYVADKFQMEVIFNSNLEQISQSLTQKVQSLFNIFESSDMQSSHDISSDILKIKKTQ